MKAYAIAKKSTHPGKRLPGTRIASHADSRSNTHEAAVRQILRGPQLQTKLTIGAPDDVYEKEADRVADEVMRMPEPVVQAAPT